MLERGRQRNLQGVFAEYFIFLTDHLAKLLSKELPSLYDDWWEKGVVYPLSHQQKLHVQQKGITSLKGLDLAGLLRVFDYNWFKVSKKLNLAPGDRNFLKEMQTIRNRWAHATPEGFPLEDIYRDLDTFQRFAKSINVQQSIIESLQVTKKGLYTSEVKQNPDIEDKENFKQESNEGFRFKLGHVVIPDSEPNKIGAVIELIKNNPENQAKVLIDGTSQIYYESQLNPFIEKKRWFPLTCEQFHAQLTALQIMFPGVSTLYSLNSARIEFIPHQFRPVLRFIRTDRPRMLIADGVGVGKTIEAGLILKEIQSRREVRSILIICPRPLVTEKKWENEMKRFDESFHHLDGKTLRYCINEMDNEGIWPQNFQKIIVPYTLFDKAILEGFDTRKKRKQNIGLLELEPPPKFDMVIVDEAHHVRNPSTYRHEAVEFFCKHAETVLFLTATPIQIGSHDLFNLLKLLRPDLINDLESFSHMGEPNPFINQAVSSMRSQVTGWQESALIALKKAGSTSWGQSILLDNPEYKRICSQLKGVIPNQQERVKLISETEELHTFSGIINRTRRRDIGEFTVRKPETVLVPFTPEQEEFHNELMRIQEEKFTLIHDQSNVKFMMTTIRRQAASCLNGLVPFLKEILDRHIDELVWEEADDTAIPILSAINPIEDQIKLLMENALTLKGPDNKLEAVIKIIQNKQLLTNKKIMLFSSFRHTLVYLYENLNNMGFRVGMIHGGTPDSERLIQRHRFEKTTDDKLDILLFSEIGCEGLDYQFCDCIINYDLPWNPMRVEQRIGRIDRHGQKSKSVSIINLITPGTVDAEIYERCMIRIGVFEKAIGGSEEILGEITNKINQIAENYTLSRAEREEQFQQLADNKIRLIQEMEDLEQKQIELFGIDLPKEKMNEDINSASSFWLSPSSLTKLVSLYLQKVCDNHHQYILGEGPLKTLRLAKENRDKLLGDFINLRRQNTPTYRKWEKWLKGSQQHLNVTFESDCANKNPEATFIMPLHPLIKQATKNLGFGKNGITNLKVKSNYIMAGNYKFAIYRWRYHGIKEDMVLKPIASDPLLTEHLLELLEDAEDHNGHSIEDVNLTEFENLEKYHYPFWQKAKEDHLQKTREIVNFRKESISASHNSKISLHNEIMAKTGDEGIKKMHLSQIESAEFDYARRVQDLEIALERADIVSEPVVFGFIQIQKV